jgi:hypothetical protein
MTHTIEIKNNTLRMHEYIVSPLSSGSSLASHPQVFKLKPGAKNPNALPSWDEALPNCITIRIESSRLTIKATTEIITKEGFLPLSKEFQVDLQDEDSLADDGKCKTGVIEHRQVMFGDNLKGGGIETEMVVS